MKKMTVYTLSYQLHVMYGLMRDLYLTKHKDYVVFARHIFTGICYDIVDIVMTHDYYSWSLLSVTKTI